MHNPLAPLTSAISSVWHVVAVNKCNCPQQPTKNMVKIYITNQSTNKKPTTLYNMQLYKLNRVALVARISYAFEFVAQHTINVQIYI